MQPNANQTNQPAATGGSKPQFILLMNCSPRPRRHTQALLDSASAALQAFPQFEVRRESFAGKTILPCQGCYDRCAQAGRCWLNDDFEALANAWLSACGILLGSPVYTFGPPAPVYAFFERLRVLQRANPQAYVSSAWPQPVGIIAQGGSAYGGVEVSAQALAATCLEVGATPISGDMPGFSQGVIGQVEDTQAAPAERLLSGAARLAARLAELVDILSAGVNRLRIPLQVLVVRANGSSPAGEPSALEAVLSDVFQNAPVPVDWQVFDFGDQQVSPCQACTQYCSRDLECVFPDAMQAFRRQWLAADAVYWLVDPQRESWMPSLRATIDRMNQTRFETHFARGQAHMPRYLKSAAILASGRCSELCGPGIQYLRHISLLYQNLLVPGGGTVETLNHTLDLGVRLRSGLAQLSTTLPDEYYPSDTRLGEIQLAGNRLASTLSKPILP